MVVILIILPYGGPCWNPDNNRRSPRDILRILSVRVSSVSGLDD